ncbi:MAG: 3-oxoacyl-[acyl-carrier-protein] reductase [Endomicrobium sp.]|jgi:3-oxoacyl-[acyl-carrier protein] reductase|nr:3-oxoacyl-[acyl-carrier-protein] reductase [Endomicrobium sp.]
MKLYNQVAMITGGAKGIGKAIANSFANEGATIVLFDINDVVLNQTADNIKKRYGIEVITVVGDVTNYNECQTAVKNILDKVDKIDILINNAGITKDNLVIRMSEQDWDDVISINLKGVFNVTKSVVKSMIKRRYGRIINIASVVGQIGNIGQINYAATKGGVIAITKTCAKEFASRNILVNAIAPGFIATDMTNNLTEQQKNYICSVIPLARFGNVVDIARAALFLASEDSSYITGHILSVNGGIYM